MQESTPDTLSDLQDQEQRYRYTFLMIIVSEGDGNDDNATVNPPFRRRNAAQKMMASPTFDRRKPEFCSR